MAPGRVAAFCLLRAPTQIRFRAAYSAAMSVPCRVQGSLNRPIASLRRKDLCEGWKAGDYAGETGVYALASLRVRLDILNQGCAASSARIASSVELNRSASASLKSSGGRSLITL